MPLTVTLHVVGALSGEALCSLRIERSSLVRAVKEELCRRLEGLPPAAQRLLLGDRCLQDGEKLGDLLPRGTGSAKLSLLKAAAEAAALRDIEAGRVELEDLSEALRGNRDVVLAAIGADGLALEHASEELRRDRDVVLTAVKESGAALRHASSEVQADKDIVMAAVKQYGMAFQWASEGLRGDWEVGLSAVKSNWKALEHGTDKLCGDREFMLAALRECRNPEVFRHISEGGPGAQPRRGLAPLGGLRHDKALFLAAVSEHPLTFAYAASALQFDRNVVLDVVRVNGRAVGFASDEVKQDPAVMAAASKTAPDAANWAWNYNSYAG